VYSLLFSTCYYCGCCCYLPLILLFLPYVCCYG
jgi:hypothetical protein